MASTPTLDRVDDTVRRRSTDLVELSHAIHAEPELAFAEHRSCAKAQSLVAERGFEITAAAGGLDTAFRADFGSGSLTVGICAEYDALPGIGHACGHNIIAASAVGAALALADVADELGLTVSLLGTPTIHASFDDNTWLYIGQITRPGIALRTRGHLLRPGRLAAGIGIAVHDGYAKTFIASASRKKP